MEEKVKEKEKNMEMDEEEKRIVRSVRRKFEIMSKGREVLREKIEGKDIEIDEVVR